MRHNRRRVTSRLSVVFLALIGLTAVGITGGNPASADVGIPDFASVNLLASEAIARSVNTPGTYGEAFTGATDVTYFSPEATASLGGTTSVTPFKNERLGYTGLPVAGKTLTGQQAPTACKDWTQAGASNSYNAAQACVIAPAVASAQAVTGLYRFYCDSPTNFTTCNQNSLFTPGLNYPNYDTPVTNATGYYPAPPPPQTSTPTATIQITWPSNLLGKTLNQPYTFTATFPAGTWTGVCFVVDGNQNLDSQCGETITGPTTVTRVAQPGCCAGGYNSIAFCVSANGSSGFHAGWYYPSRAANVNMSPNPMGTPITDCNADESQNIARDTDPIAPPVYGGGVPCDQPGGYACPQRQLVTTTTCVNTSNVTTTVSATGPNFKMGWGPTYALAPAAACPAGNSVQTLTVVAHSLDGITPDRPIYKYTITTTNGVLPVQVILYQNQGDGTTQTCEQYPSPCKGWWDDSTRTQKYTCKRGSTVLTLTDCETLRYRYQATGASAASSSAASQGSSGTASDSNTTNSDGSVSYNCFDGMGLSPLSWPKGLIISPFKCLFVPASGATQWKDQINSIKNSGVFAVPTAIITTTTGFVNSANDSTKTCNDNGTQLIYKDSAHPNGVAKTTPISFCAILTSAGNQMQSTTLGVYLWNGSRIMLVLWFGFYWYNRIAASAGAQAEV